MELRVGSFDITFLFTVDARPQFINYALLNNLETRQNQSCGGAKYVWFVSF